MGLLDLFKAKPRLSTRADVVDWLDTRAAFITQKGIHEYSRARAGINWQAIYQEQAFIAALDLARWRAYPIGLALVAEMIDGVLRPLAGVEPPVLSAALAGCALEAFDRHPVFPAIGDDGWARLRAELKGRVEAVSLHPVKPVKDIAVPYGAAMFDLMPMHPDVKQQDSLIVHSNLRIVLIALHRDFLKEFDAAAAARAVVAGAAPSGG